ncbi:MAG: FtsX-like permease family protein, partial [Ilumatobacter fluminis]
VSLPFRATTTGSIAAMNAVADARRTAATAGPVALMMAINVGMVQATVAANDMGTEGSQMWSLWIMIAISVGFAAIAVVNTTAMTIVRRRTELASLRLAGATPAQTRRSSQTEAVIAALTGSAIGVVIATAACWAFAVATGVSLIGMFEPALIGGLAGFAMVLAAGSAHVAARRAIGDPTLLVEVE